MKIKSISFSNFKYVTKDKKIKIDLSGTESLILGGPNGYGKTTIFDVIELLITGQIRHFNADLLNRGKENISVLANDITDDIYVAAEFISDEIILVERKFISDKNFESLLKINNEVINDEQLFSKLGINKNLFSIGIYISQLDSLNFLQQKYKTRKESITGILDSSHIINRFNELKEIRESLKKRFEQEEKADSIKLTELDRNKCNIRDEIQRLQLSQENIPYKRLFKDKEYNFDKEFFEKEETYDAVILPVNDLIDFCKYKQAFMIKKRNKEIKEIINIDKKLYVAQFFNKEINECKIKKRILDIANEFIVLRKSYEQKQFYYNEIVSETLGLTNENIQQINQLLEQKKSIEKSMSETQTSLSKILKQRTDFLTDYDVLVKEHILPNNICPFCGRESKELRTLFSETEAVLKSNLGLITIQLSDIVKKLTVFFDLYIIPKVDDFLNSNHKLIEQHNILSSFINISIEDLSKKLEKENILFANTKDEVDFSVFEEKYKELINTLCIGLVEETEIISEELYTKLLRILLEYYTQIEPYDEQTLLNKKFYISTLFSNSLSHKLQEAENKYNELYSKIENKKSRYNDVFENISIIIRKYDTARKQYESTIAKNIALPMFIFSGKIIQNYPLGLGVFIQVEDNAVVFKTENMKSDIFNNLSTGQLNGVIISLLLSIKEVFTTNNSLNILLIDDPLQTIDEISAISFIDLLLEHFGDTQVILSTHEDDKQFLIKKKYEQNGRRCRIINMQDKYLGQ